MAHGIERMSQHFINYVLRGSRNITPGKEIFFSYKRTAFLWENFEIKSKSNLSGFFQNISSELAQLQLFLHQPGQWERGWLYFCSTDIQC